jgi:sigma-B regulation protein RsbU (phosphoserine phosphatase)
MFVTVFVGILNLQTGEFVYANGGHNPPLVLVAGGEPTFLEPPGGPVLGVMEGATFRMDRCVLSPGTTLLAYTDGVTEAFDKNGEAFSDERLLAAVSSLGQRSAKDITETLTTKIDEFCGGAPQADDITVLCLMFKHTSHRN